MSLQRKENNLRKAQERFDRVNKRTKEFQIDFRREQNSRGRFRTRPHIVRDYKQFHGNNRGLLHKAVNLKYRVHGDVPSVTKTLKSWQPESLKGKVLRANTRAVNFAVHDASRTAADTALAAETVGLKGADAGQRELRNTLKQKYTREAVDDYHRGVFLMGRTTADAVKSNQFPINGYNVPVVKLQEICSESSHFKIIYVGNFLFRIHNLYGSIFFYICSRNLSAFIYFQVNLFGTVRI